MNPHELASRWFHTPRPSRDPALRLICLPHAGASSQVFQAWPEGLPAGVELCAAQLPGRAFRLAEPAIDRMDALVEALLTAVRPLLDRPFALFGHSMGALVAFELTRRLRREAGPAPAHLFLSAYRAPHLPQRAGPLHALPADRLYAELHDRHGAPDGALADPELRELMLPALRADFAVIERHLHADEPPLAVPMTALGGHDDHGVPAPDIAAWAVHTTRRFDLAILPGDHFYLHGAREPLLAHLSRELTTWLPCPTQDTP